MNQQKFKRSERGQAIYFVVISIIVLLGFAGLAIDGGRLYAERRQAQNAADTASYTAALIIAQNTLVNPKVIPGGITNNAITAAKAVAADNGFNDAASNQTVTVTITGPFTDDGIYYLATTDITSQIPPMFIHLVYGGDLTISAHAVAKVRPVQNIVYGAAVFGASEHDCDAIKFHGNLSASIHGGGIMSNSDANGVSSCYGLESGGASGSVAVDSPYTIDVVGNSNCSICSPSATTGVNHVGLPDTPELDCSALGLTNRSVSGTTLYPGRYTSELKLSGNTDVVLDPGIYCLEAGADLGGKSVTGSGVFFYVEGGGFNTGGNTDVSLAAATDLMVDGYQFGGMLIYMDPDNHGLVTMQGNADSSYTGTVYAPSTPSPASQPKCSVLGTAGNIAVSAQLICYTIDIGGNATFDITFDKASNFKLPSTISLED